MKKSILFYLLPFVNLLFANDISIPQLQGTFFKEVNEKNIYLKHYTNFLYETCQNNQICINETITRLKSWESVQNNPFLKKYQKKYYKQTQVSPFTLEKIEQYLHEVIQAKQINTSQFLTFLDLIFLLNF